MRRVPKGFGVTMRTYPEVMSLKSRSTLVRPDLIVSIRLAAKDLPVEE